MNGEQKLQPHHLARRAVVYLRQSSPEQVKNNKESQLMQYALADRARALGFHQVEVIDVDLQDELVERYDELVPVLMGLEEGHAPRQLCNYFLNENNVRAFLEIEAG